MDSFRNFLNKFKPQDKSNSPALSNADKAEALVNCEVVIYQYVTGGQSAYQVIDALKTMAQIGTSAHILSVYQLCLDRDHGVRRQAWKTIDEMLRDAPIHLLPSISIRLRQECETVEPKFNGIERGMPLKFVGMLSFDRNGFVREVAVKDLASWFDGKELPFIILAANDWVSNIHVLATEALEKRANKQYAPYLVENLSLLRRLWRSGRHQFGRLQEDIENLVAAELRAQDLPGLFSTDPERQLWQYAYKLCIEAPNRSAEEIDELIKFGLYFNDIRIQQIAAGKALKQYSLERLQEFVPLLLTHHLPQIRRESLRWIVDNKWGNVKETLIKCLFDRSMSVRLLAQFHMEKAKTHSLYEDNLRDQKFSL
jgi:hypothetical protein